jgi:hypothetical protein
MIFSQSTIKIQVPIFVALALAVLLASCATVPKEVLDTEPCVHLETSPQIYLRLSGGALRDITKDLDNADMSALASILAGRRKDGSGTTEQDASPDQSARPGFDSSTIRSFLARTKTFGAGISGIGTKSPSVETVLIGDFPALSMRLALAANREWEKTPDGGYRSTEYPVFIRTPQPGVFHAANSPAAPDTSSDILPYPAQMASLATSDIFISANAPAAFFAGAIPLEASAIPVNAIVLAGRSADDGRGDYLLDVHIVMKDETTARAYRPVVRFLWTAVSGRLFGGVLGSGALPLALEGNTYTASDIEADPATLRALLTSPLLFR